MVALVLAFGGIALIPAPAATAADAAAPLLTHVADVTVGSRPTNVAVDEAAHRAYVTNTYGASVSVIDTDDNTVIDTLPIADYAQAVAVDSARHRLYVVRTYGMGEISTVFIIDTQNYQTIDTVDVGKYAMRLAVNETTGMVYVSNQVSDSVSVIDPASNTVVATIPMPNGTAAGIAVDETTDRIFVADSSYSAALVVVDGNTNTVITTRSVGANASDVLFSPSTHQITVLVPAEPFRLQVFDSDDYSLVGTVATGDYPGYVFESERTGLTYVSNSYELSVYDPSTTLVGKVEMHPAWKGGSPIFGVTMDQTTGRIYAVNQRSDQLEVWQEPFAPAITTTTLPPGTVGAAYDQTIAATGSPAASFAVSSGALPDGLALETDGRLHGAATGEGSASFTVTATNSAGSDSQDYTLAVGRPPSMTTDSLPSGLVGEAYDQTIAATGSAPVTFAVTDGALPPGLNLNDDGTLTGTLGAEGSYAFTVTATNAYGTDEHDFSVSSRVPPNILTTSLAGGVVGQPYSQQIDARGTAPLAFSVAEGALPDGLALNRDTGEISGVPTAEQGADLTIRATNAAGSDEQSYTITVGRAPSIMTTTLPVAIDGKDYDQPIVVDGTDPVHLALTAGSLPDGLEFDTATGEIVGTPAVDGTFSFTITATNAQGSDSQDYSLLVGTVPQITTRTLPGTIAGESYAAALEANGTGPITWTIAAGALPHGLALDAATGKVIGTATTAGSSDVTISATNAVGADRSDYAVTVDAAGLATMDLAASATSVRQGGSVTLAVTGADAFGNPLGDLTSEAAFTSDHPDTIAGAKVTFPSASKHVITATIGAVSDSITIDVSAAGQPGAPSVPGAGSGSAAGAGGGTSGGEGHSLADTGSSVPVLALVLALGGILAGGLLLGRRRYSSR